MACKDGAFRVVKTIADDRIRGDRQLTLEFFGLEPGTTQEVSLHDGICEPGAREREEVIAAARLPAVRTSSSRPGPGSPRGGGSSRPAVAPVRRRREE